MGNIKYTEQQNPLVVDVRLNVFLLSEIARSSIFDGEFDSNVFQDLLAKTENTYSIEIRRYCNDV